MSDRFDVFDSFGNFIGEFVPSGSDDGCWASLFSLFLVIILWTVGFLIYLLIWLIVGGFKAASKGDWGKALNSVFLYVNAGIQGSRTLVRNLGNKPIQTTAKIGLTVLTPLAMATAWNMSDPKRLAAYNDIRNSEKDNNLVLIPDNPTKDANGKWNVIKVPFSQEIANLTIPMRKGMEALQGADGPSFMDVAAGLLGSATSLNTQSGNALFGQFIPQAVKPGLEAILNKNTFTGTDIVPQYINGAMSKDLPPELQVRSNTSGTARIIGKVVNTSPLKVEQFIKSTFGGVGSQTINASDNALAMAGVIPKEQIGGQSISEGIAQRFSQSAGGNMLDNIYNTHDQLQSVKKQMKILIDEGKMDKAVAIMKQNQSLFANKDLITGTYSQYSKLNKARNKIKNNYQLTPQQKDGALKIINKMIDDLSAGYYKATISLPK